jgi:hypothetical protein
MAKKLSHEDSRAIDMLLDRNGTGGMVMAGSSNVKSGKMNMKNRIKAADRMLRVLGQMPAVEPAADLVQRTLARIDAAPGTIVPGILPAAQRYAGSDNRPHA